MRKSIIKFLKITSPVFDLIFVLLSIPSSLILKITREFGIHRLPLTLKFFKFIGIFPIRDHFHEPLFNDKHLKKPLNIARNLPGLKFNEKKQLQLLSKLNFKTEFIEYVEEEQKSNSKYNFDIKNHTFAPGDSEFLFQVVRYFKPKKIIEIGGGSSTLIINKAVKLNNVGTKHNAKHICIEPYRNPWLENLKDVKVIRQQVENSSINWKNDLKNNDLLFIDSSHIIRPQGDVLFEYLEIIPKLPKGVIVHVHDIFTPYEYPNDWIRKNIFLWNEQYLLEVLLSNFTRYEIIASLHLLKNKFFDNLKTVCPYLKSNHLPGSIYFRVK